jgi:hypothetical protein
MSGEEVDVGSKGDWEEEEHRASSSFLERCK